MSGAMENRAAVFASQPQDVEVYRDGVWWPGSLLGWRHDRDGACQVWVRIDAGAGAGEEPRWTSLDLLRLPEPECAPAPPGRHLTVVDLPVADDVALTGTMAAIRAVPAPAPRRSAGESGSSDLTATMNLFAVRDLDERAESMARHPVSTTLAGRSSGRRRAPESAETAEEPIAGRVPPLVVSPGRHRAPAAVGATPGRHRAADTGVWPAVRPDDHSAVAGPSLPSSAAPLDEGLDAHLLTRPMRLDDVPGRVPQPRRPVRNGRLAGL